MKAKLKFLCRENGDARSPLPVFSGKRIPTLLLAVFLTLGAVLLPEGVPVLPAYAVEAEDGGSGLLFEDVPEDAWYRNDVAAAVSAGLVNGRSRKVFAPLEPVLRCEAVKLAACLYERAETGTVSLESGGEVWYSTYAAYAAEKGIADPGLDYDWTLPATRGEIFDFFSRALPEAPVEINEVPDGSIPDVPVTHPHAAGIYALYRMGAAQGYDYEAHACRPDSFVTRAECAATLMRLYDPANRVRFSMTASKEPLTELPADSFTEQPETYTAEREWSPLTLAWAEAYESRFGAGSSDEILMSADEIAAYNAAMTASCPTLEDLAAWPDSVAGTLVASKIRGYVFPSGYDYDADGNYVGDQTRAGILSNRALGALSETVAVRRAVVTSRCDLRAFPSRTVFAPNGNPGFDQAQETELCVGMPVCVLHESADGCFLFVQAYHYAGWIPAEAAAECGKDTFDRFVKRDPESGVTVTSVSVTAGGARLDMGVWLPLLGESAEGYEVLLPVRGNDGSYAEAAVVLPYSDAVRGVLPYTVRNFYEQAFRFLGVLYGWGGKDGGVDCSGFVCAVMRTFGIELPRNTSEQRVWGGRTTDLSSLGAEDRIAALTASRFPVALYRKGHVMLFLGVSDGKIRIVHAYSIGKPVSLDALEPWGDILTMVEFRQ